ncbi:hypothetical protein TUN199_12329, partial [Pyrenophora tritici-repentis]
EYEWLLKYGSTELWYEKPSKAHLKNIETQEAADPFVHGSHFHGKQIYKLIKCGSRDAAVSEAYHSAG